MNKQQPPNDHMPSPNSPEYLDLVGIKFASRYSAQGFTPAGRDELLKEMDKDMLLDPFDEADSRSKVERFLSERGA